MTWRVEVGDCVDLMAALEPGSVDAVVCDPPYNLSFMSRAWDSFSGTDIDPGFLHWFAGFVDGEGCFSVHKKNVNGYETYDCQFSISLRADDRPILERIHRTLGIGTLSKPTAHTRGGRDGNPQARYAVSAKPQLVVLRDIFRAFPLRAKKARDFELWSDALDAWLSHEPGEWSELAEARALLMASREYVAEGVRVDPFQMWCWRWGRQALRVLKPGGHCLAFGGTRTSHRLAAGLEDAGFEIRDTICWLYGQGFPKSLDVSKAIDKAAGHERGSDYEPNHGNAVFGDGMGGGVTTRTDPPVTDDARTWQGWGTALKPAHEPIVVARKPLAGTVAANVLQHGTGALNVDGCRIEGEMPTTGQRPQGNSWGNAGFNGQPSEYRASLLGRWPANVALDEEAAGMLDEQSGELTSGKSDGFSGPYRAEVFGKYARNEIRTETVYGDSGGASRFFYVAKASRAERNAGLDGFEESVAWAAELPHTRNNINSCNGRQRNPRPSRNHHPTVKPVNLMRWLVRLVTPPGGLVLDPFAGSGTTGIAAVLEGFDFLGMERDPEYAALAEARIGWWAEHGEDALRIVAEQERADLERQAVAASGQLDMFGKPE